MFIQTSLCHKGPITLETNHLGLTALLVTIPKLFSQESFPAFLTGELFIALSLLFCFRFPNRFLLTLTLCFMLIPSTSCFKFFAAAGAFYSIIMS